MYLRNHIASRKPLVYLCAARTPAVMIGHFVYVCRRVTSRGVLLLLLKRLSGTTVPPRALGVEQIDSSSRLDL